MTATATRTCVSDTGIVELAEALKILGDPNRLRILCLLLKGERCVCEVERELGISQQLTSHHLNVLRESGLLRARREGTSSHYSVAEEKLQAVTGVFLRYLGYRGDPGGGAHDSYEACCTSAPATREATVGGAARQRGGKRR